ncbi:MAG: glycosyltransferase [Planctomycetes bacterium]|nr:glycosyltransferase [Planctomycetota bacterium]
MRKIKIVIFTASYGGGHHAVSGALADGFRKYYPNHAEVKIIDYMKRFAPKRDKVLRKLYEESTKHFPWVYGLFFSASDKMFAGRLGGKLGTIGGTKAEKWLQRTKPDILVFAYPAPAKVIPSLVLKHQPFTATIVTDFGVHAQWVHPNTDVYCVPSDEVKKYLTAEYKIDDKAIKVTGIPLRLAFAKPVDKAVVRRKYKLDGIFTVVLMCGGQSWSDIKSICRKLVEIPVQVVLLGGNKEILSKMQKLKGENKKIVPIGFIKEVNEIMKVSDVVIGKAGGITVSESLAYGLPVIMFRPYPGQEIYNRDYIVKHRAGYFARDPEEVFQKVKYICKNKPRLKEMGRNAARIGRPDSTEDVCRIVMDGFRKRGGGK